MPWTPDDAERHTHKAKPSLLTIVAGTFEPSK
jgi:hypothetical protein